MNMSAAKRHVTIERIREELFRLRPHPHAMIRAIAEELPRIEDFVPDSILADSFLGMSPEQVGELAADPLFSVGIHTIDHPYLTKCDDQEALRQINGNRAWLENVCGSQIDVISYPLGDYNSAILRQCREQDINLGFAVVPRLEIDERREVPRLGVYHSSTEVLRFKIKWGQTLRSIGLKIG
jgi:peptidoglycan/xylan/chitin deacetylase (PgdA/CDA1 family)